MAPRLQAFLAIVFWGISFVATRLALREVSPVTLIFTRFALGVALLHVVLAARGLPLLPPRSSLPTLAAMGFIGIFFHQVIQSNALTMTTAVRTGWLIGVTPIWSALLALTSASMGKPFSRQSGMSSLMPRGSMTAPESW